jgi:hypothetical protein
MIGFVLKPPRSSGNLDLRARKCVRELAHKGVEVFAPMVSKYFFLYTVKVHSSLSILGGIVIVLTTVLKDREVCSSK